MSAFPLLTSRPGIMGGAITIRGTRLTLDTMRAVIASRGEAAACLAYPSLDAADAHEIGAWSPRWPGRVVAEWGPPGNDTSPWRISLTCVWDGGAPRLAVCGLNPSTATPTEPDPTCVRWLGMAIRWGFGGLTVINRYSLRATSPKDLKDGRFAIAGHAPRIVGVSAHGGPRDAAALLAGCAMLLVCWGGNRADLDGWMYEFKPCYLHRTAGGVPIHPLARIKGVEVSKLRPRDWTTGEIVRLPIDEVSYE